MIKQDNDMTVEEFVRHIKQGLPDIPVTTKELMMKPRKKKSKAEKKESPGNNKNRRSVDESLAEE